MASLALLLLSPLLGYEHWELIMREEGGFYEIATILILLPAIPMAAWVVFHGRHLPSGISAIVLLGGLAALYFAGEEASWGQHMLGFETPDSIAEINGQKEFNIHNLNGGAVFNNVIRQAMLLGCLVLGVIIPLIRKYRIQGVEHSFGKERSYWIVPTLILVPAAALAFLSGVPNDILDEMNREFAIDSYVSMTLIEPAGEFKEFCFAQVILLYLWSVFLRARSFVRVTKAG